MAEHPNVELIRRAYEAFAQRDIATLSDLFAEAIVWHNHGSNPLSGDYRGRDAVFAMFGKNLELNGGTGQLEVHDIVANDAHAVALVRATSSRPGKDKHLDVKEAHIFHIRDGKITEAWVFSEDQRLNDEFWNA